jgi:hypothetical protein
MKKLTKYILNKIKKDPNSINWERACKTYKLSEGFIREFQDEVVWSCISEYKKLSEEFLVEFVDKVNLR